MKEPCGCSDDLLLKEKQAANEIRKCIYRYKLKESIRSKGGNARYHFGVGAQTLGVIMRNNGLNPEKYGFWCKDETDFGDRYGVRYDELMMFVLKYL
ncbi:TPA: hypothetical protein ACWOOY_005312, partial [Escherichia coli]